VLRNGAINLVIKPEVSQLDFGHTVQIAGIAIPPLIVRRASTTIELQMDCRVKILCRRSGRGGTSAVPNHH
jgi:hypothetical protein